LVPTVELLDTSDHREKYQQTKNCGQEPYIIAVVVRRAELQFGIETAEKRIDDNGDEDRAIDRVVG
jgi:hypothetical protein